jgi:hypothetical protein
MEMFPPWFASAEVAMLLASLVKPPVALIVILPAGPGTSVVPSALEMTVLLVLALLI